MENVISESLSKVPSEEDMKNIKNAISECINCIEYVKHEFDNLARVPASRFTKINT